jgi:MFS family permease
MASRAISPASTQNRIVLLFALAMLINYADRGSLSVVAPKLAGDIGISNAMLGLLLSAFFWVYAPAQIVAGWCAQSFPIRWVMAGGFALWSLATLATGFAQGLVMLFGLRLLLGLGESVIFPCIARNLAEASAEAERGRANGWISGAIALGPMVGTFAGGMILAHYGWRTVFFSFGIVSLLWLVPWLSIAQPRPSLPVAAKAEHRSDHGPGYAIIIRKRAMWGAAGGHFCTIIPII